MSKTAALSKMTTVEEVLETVAEFDREAHSFYVDLVPKVSKNIRYIVEDLARSELEHIIKLRELARSKEPGRPPQGRDPAPRGGPALLRRDPGAGTGDNPDDQEVLAYALARVQVAIEEYAELAANTPPGPLHEVFSFLANEESKHKSDLEALYYQVVHSGGV
ncbi:MAG: ferritin family protein [Paracoccaceae bacterium]